MQRNVVSAALMLLTSVTLVTAALATPLTTVLDVQGQGLSLATGGVGLEDLGAGSKNIQVTVGGPVQAALLYWVGRDLKVPAPVSPTPTELDRDIRFAGVPLSGTVVGTEEGFGANVGYVADVTSIVQAAGTGTHNFAIQDNDLTRNLDRLNGAGILVIYTDPNDNNTYRIIIKNGLDFAFGPLDPADGPAAARVTDPVTFNYTAEAANRTGQLVLFVGDPEAGRPDRIDISNNPSVFNALDGSQGVEFDVEDRQVAIPAGVASTTVQLFSEPLDQNPDSLLWVLGALRVPLAPPPPRPASLGDFVWNDLNGNGCQDANEPGVANVTVKLFGAANALVATTTTDASGFYAFTNLTPGTYHVEFTKPSGFDFTGANLCPDDKDSDANSSGVAPNVTLASGEHNPTIDAGLKAVPPPPPPGNGATRTQGYWGSHLAALTAAVNAGYIDLGVLAVVPSGTQDLNDATLGEAEAIMHGKIGGRSDLGQARMQLAQQLVAAFANVGFLGTTTQSKGYSPTLLQDAVDALEGTDVDLIKSFIGSVTGFNESGDGVGAPSLAQFGSADPQGAKAAANKTGNTIDPGPAFE